MPTNNFVLICNDGRADRRAMVLELLAMRLVKVAQSVRRPAAPQEIQEFPAFADKLIRLINEKLRDRGFVSNYIRNMSREEKDHFYANDNLSDSGTGNEESDDE